MLRNITEYLYRRYGVAGVDLNKAPFSHLYKIYAHTFLLDKRIPPFFNLEPTNYCNLKCTICPSSRSARDKGFISLSLVKKIAAEVSGYGGRSFFLFKDGEPFLHKSFFEIVKIIKGAHKGNKVYISTNGQLVDMEITDKLIDLKVDNINFSIDNATEEGYYKVRGSSLRKVEENIGRLIKTKTKKRSRFPDIAIHYVRYQENENEVEAFKCKWQDSPVSLKFMYFNSWTGFFSKGKKFDESERYPCFSLWMFPSINWDGKVSICCVDWNQQEVIGNLNEQSFEEIWNCNKIKRYREHHLKGEYNRIPICAECNVWASRPNFCLGSSWRRRGE